MKNLCFIACLLFTSSLFAQTTFKKLVWSDEFNYTGLPDTAKWKYDVGGHGWGNNELQYYTKADSRNARVENGNLIIEARKDSFENKAYTSARLLSTGAGNWTYGRVEVRAKLPAGLGLWPAIWMLSTDWKYGGWPESGEIDIMEHVGYMPDSVFASVHSKAYNHVIHTQKTQGIYVKPMYGVYHVYAIEWTADKIDFFLDGKKYFTAVNEHTGFAAWPFDQPFHLLLNLAVGGNWGGIKGVNTNVFPAKMLVDYVRVYQ